MYVCVYLCTYHKVMSVSKPGGFQGYWLNYTAKGPQFEETNTQII